MHRFIVRALSFAAGIALSTGSFAQVGTTGTDTLPAGGFVDYSFPLQSGQVAAFITTPLGGLPANFLVPDTRVDIMNPPGTVITSNDDGGTSGVINGLSATNRGSAARYLATSSTTTTMRVRGFGATDAGLYCWTRAVFTPGVTTPDFSELEPNDTLATATPVAILPNQVKYGRASLAAGENDYYSVPMAPGDVLSFLIIPTGNLPTNFSVPDTRLDARSLLDVVITSNDDTLGSDAVGLTATTARGSAMRWYSGTATTAILTVRGFGTSDAGNYEMIVSKQNILVPEPGTISLGLLGLSLGLLRRRRS